jgi:polyhydroxyalkanoate synthase
MDVQARVFAEQQRVWRRLLNLPRILQAAWNTPVGTTPHDVVLDRPAFKLLRYRRKTPAAHAEPMLFCYALVNRSYILDLQPDKSVVGRYLEQGFDVYMIDWAVPTHADRGRTLDDYVCKFLKEAVDFIVREHARKDLHLLGYCMGGTMAASLTALHPERVKSLTLLAAPIDFSGRQSLLNLWTDRRYFDVDAFIDAYGNCPGWFLQSSFLWLKPVQNMIDKAAALFEQMDDAAKVSACVAMERWINDNVPVAGATFCDFVKKLYQGNELMLGKLQLGGRRVDLGWITCPLLLVTAANDHLVAPSATEGIRGGVRSSDIKSLALEAGHVGVVVGGQAQRTIWPRATRWLADRSKSVEGARPRARDFVAAVRNDPLPEQP